MWGWSVPAATTRLRRVVRMAISAASAVADAPSYMEALATSQPVSPQIIVCHSKMACRVPWLISGW